MSGQAGAGGGRILYLQAHRTGQGPGQRGAVGDGALHQPTGEMGRHPDHSGGRHTVLPGLLHEPGDPPHQHRVHDSGRHRHDSGGLISADHGCPGPEHHPPGGAQRPAP